jgi:hypothetical protein
LQDRRGLLDAQKGEGQRVVHLVGDASQQRPQGRQTIAAHETRLGLLARADVAGKSKNSGDPFPFDGHGVHLGQKPAAIAAADAVLARQE